ncbi:myb-related transcription factor, partner of profilin-like [Epinephelus fuscoguttatus]|uniref:myb-related transcription factor, partner of profilin-like n=1 Tax=Epinephelus fuscoguttatus TaxID=293821 RepID=UPI0020D16CBC|nr:myb-related transcription factor, partner of profilin-like [Epinephelus fuscoguttatus]
MASLERKRKVKFDPMELEVLVDEANKHLHELQQKNLSVSQRTAIWEEICENVNAVSKTVRTVHEVKRRHQDIRRRTKEKLAYNKTSVDEIPLTKIEEQVQLTFCEEQVTGIAEYDTLDLKAEQESSSEVQPSPSNSPRAAATPAEPRKGPEDIDLEMLQEQKKQSAALQTIAREMRVASSLARAARRDTQAIATHCRQVVSAVSALTMAVNSVARELREGVQALTALNPGGEVGRPSPTATARQPGTGEGGEVRTADKFHLRKRKHK